MGHLARLAVRSVSRGAVEARVQANVEHATHVPDKSMNLARKCKARYLFFVCVRPCNHKGTEIYDVKMFFITQLSGAFNVRGRDITLTNDFAFCARCV